MVEAFAVGFHAIPRYTQDLDLLVEPTVENGARICRALTAFGGGSLKITPGDCARPGRVIQLGYEPVRVDLITSIAGVTFDQVWRHRQRGRYGTVPVPLISLDDLTRSQQASRRAQDLADLALLRQVARRHSPPVA